MVNMKFRPYYQKEEKPGDTLQILVDDACQKRYFTEQ